jgi:hypothetical protein
MAGAIHSEEKKKAGIDAGPLYDCPQQASWSCQVYFLMVESLKVAYRGQKPTRLVTRKTTARIPRMMANVPEMTPVK